MKITIFGLTISSSWGNGHATPYRAIVRALSQMGHEVHFFEKDAPWYHLRRDFAECDYCRLTFYSAWPEIRRYALKTARESDVVLTASYLPDGHIISDEILLLGQPMRVFYDMDTPVTLRNLENGGAGYVRRDQIPEFDLVLSFSGGPILRRLEQHYGARLARPLYGCVDPDIYFRVIPAPEFACDLSYMGTFAEDRQSKVEELFLGPASRYPEMKFVLAGSMYPWDWQWPGNVRRVEHVPPAEHPAFYSSSRLTLNITRSEMARWGWCPSGRFFEASACGTPIVTDWWEGLDAFFDPVREVHVISSTEDADRALNLPGHELQMLAARARQRTLDEHTGRVRAVQLLRYLEEARSASALKLQTEAS